ncbi:MAG: formyltransferase family protein, partial [Microgenomates group bacterium]
MSAKNLVYFGSPDFSAQILQSLLPPSKLVRVVGVVTAPDKPRGRKQILTPSPVAQTAAKHDLPVFKPAKLDDANFSHLSLLKPDIFLVVSYGKIIPRSYLNTPTIGTFNIHFSLLPKYR